MTIEEFIEQYDNCVIDTVNKRIILPDAYNGRRLYKGSKGGDYYINSNGNKIYVDLKNCYTGVSRHKL